MFATSKRKDEVEVWEVRFWCASVSALNLKVGGTKGWR